MPTLGSAGGVSVAATTQAGGQAAVAALQGGSGLSSFLSAAQPWIAAFQIAFSIIASSKARRKAKQAARESSAVRQQSVQLGDANAAIDIAYGVFASQGLHTFLHVGTDLPERPDNQIGDLPYDQRGDHRHIRRPTNVNAFLYMERVLSIGQIDGLIDFTLDGRDIHTPLKDGGLRAPQSLGQGTLGGAWLLPYEKASAFSQAFAPGRRTANTLYTGLSTVGMVADQPFNVEHRVFTNLPVPVFFARGRMIHRIVNGMRSDTVAPEDNTASVFLDMVSNPLYGVNLPSNRIDWPALQTYSDQCGRALLSMSNDPDFSGIDLDELAKRDGETNPQHVARVLHYLDGLGIAVPPSILDYTVDNWFTRLGEYLHRNGYVDRTDIGVNQKGLRLALGAIHWGAYNGLVNSALNLPDAIEQIIQTTPGTVVYPTPEGKLHISAPDWQQTASQQSVGTLTDQHGLSFNSQDIDLEGRYNRCVETYNDIDNLFHENSIAWPETTADHAVFLAEDGGILLELEERAPGICTRSQALTRARWNVLSSRRQTHDGSYSIGLFGGRIIAPNQRFRVESQKFNFTGDLIMNTVDVDWRNGVVTFTALSYKPTDNGPVLAPRHTEHDTLRERLSVGAFVRVAGIPTKPVKAATEQIRQAVSIVGTTASGQFARQWPGESVWGVIGASETDTARAGTTKIEWTPDADADCVLEAEYQIAVGNADSPTVELVACGGGVYRAYDNGFAAAPDLAWTITPTQAGTLSATDTAEVSLTGATEGVLGVLTVRAVNGSESASDSIEVPYSAIDDRRGANNTVDGPVEIL